MSKRASAKSLGENLYEDKAGVVLPPIGVDASEKSEWLLGTGVVFFSIFIAVVMTLAVFWFSQSIQVNPETGLSIFLRIGLLVVITLTLIKFRVVNFLNYLGGMFFGLCWAFNPALDYWLLG
jgi:hypothetical protein